MDTHRLRGCCDGCTRSKLKCSGDRPLCHRCEVRGQHCVYSKARRAGRPPLRSNNKIRGTPATASTIINQPPPTPITTTGDHQVGNSPCCGAGPLLSDSQGPVLSSPGSQSTALPFHDTWGHGSTPLAGLGGDSNISELGNIALHDLAWGTMEEFDLESLGNSDADGNRGSTSIEKVPSDASLQCEVSVDLPPRWPLINTIHRHTSMAQQASIHLEDSASKADTEIDALIISTTQLAEMSILSQHTHRDLCTLSWQRLLSKLQLLISVTGIQASMETSSLRLDAVLHVAWAAEHAQKSMLSCPTCMSQEMTVSSILAPMYDWVARSIVDALESPPAMQSCQLKIGSLVVTGGGRMIGVRELVKYRTSRLVHAIRHVRSRVESTRRIGQSNLYQATQFMLQGIEAQLESVAGMLELLSSEQI